MVNSKKANLFFLEKSNIINTSKDTQNGKSLKGNSGNDKNKNSIQIKKKHNETSSNIKNLDSHNTVLINKQVQTNRNGFECEICRQIFSRPDHFKIHDDDGSRPHKCSFCKASYKQKVGLRHHITVVHEKKKSYKCKVCNTNALKI